MFDTHMHSVFSHDGRMTLDTIIKQAKAINMEYIAITEHLDYDCLFTEEKDLVRQLDLDGYFKAFFQCKEKEKEKNFYLAFGVEVGYHKDAVEKYKTVLQKYPFDVIINSVHNILNKDPYFKGYFMDKKMDQTYVPYLESVLESVNADYDYDIVGHIGYITRYAPYQKRLLSDLDSWDLIDEILKSIIKRDKSLEINTQTKGCNFDFLPEDKILKRYAELGGNNLTYGSDAHDPDRIGEKFELVCNLAKSLNINYLTYYKERKALKEKIK